MLHYKEAITLQQNVGHFSEELQEYLKNKFCLKSNEDEDFIEDNSFINAWTAYCSQAAQTGSIDVLKRCYPQLNFPIEIGIEKSEKYRNAVLKGHFEEDNNENKLQLKNSQGIKISIYCSIAGKIPIIEIPDEHDFISIVQSLLYKNNPTKIPLSMGALMVNGVNNWDRLNILKKEWNFAFAKDQSNFFKKIQENPNLYKDRLIILSKKPYSNISAEALNLNSEEWLSLSYSIRLEHECTHLYTLKKYGTASNNLHDELIADYIGITTAFGSFNKKWMLEFLGLENYPKYRKGARLENYINALNLNSEDFESLISIIYKAIETIELFDAVLGSIQSKEDKSFRINSLCEIDLLNIATEKGKDLLLERYKHYNFNKEEII